MSSPPNWKLFASELFNCALLVVIAAQIQLNAVFAILNPTSGKINSATQPALPASTKMLQRGLVILANQYATHA